MLISYHNHTLRSDGEASLRAMLEAAEAYGLDEVGISDHYVLTPNGLRLFWSMPLDGLDAYATDLLIARLTSPLPLRLGVEADYFPETVSELDRRLRAQPFDYVIGSVHLVDGFSTDESADDWERLTQEERDTMWRRYYRRVAEMAASGVFDIVGHLDLPKKFGYRPVGDVSAEAEAALDAIAAAGMAMELNTAGWDKPAQEPYPAPALLAAACARGIPLLLGADAHSPSEVARHFQRGREVARAAGYTMGCRYEKRQRIAVPL